ncbi:MAG TPA: glycosyltransferase [Parvularculaceae bacterium]|nr:glycosyltransferase [Parvularculaceae bacterium]HRX40852.1 glycosyltransferase [Parvularculaceae bacterium]
MTANEEKIGYVVIGRNEGERLKECLSSLPPAKGRVIYVDSGSTDGSVDAACGFGAEVVELSTDRPFTAARARNEGVERLVEIAPGAEFVMLVDGDSVLFEGWPREGAEFLAAHPDVAAVAGRVRERHPEASLYNRLCEIEWATPAGESIACGGIAMMRIAPVREAGGFNASLGGGEEPELCLRLRERGWKIWRLGSDMAEHDAAIMSFGQWFRRMARGGRAFAEVSDLHRDSPARIWSREVARALVWAGILPASLIAGLLIHPAGFLLLAAYPLQIVRLAMFGRSALPPAAHDHAWLYAIFMTLAKFAEAKGVASYWFSRGRH